MSGRILPFRSGCAAPSAKAAAASADVGPGSRISPSDLRLTPGAGSSGTATRLPSPSQAPRFRTLVMPHLDAAYSLARYLARDATAAEDIAQDALLRAFRGLDSLRGAEVKPWLMAIVRNAYFDWRRRSRGWEDMAVRGLDDAIDAVADPDAESPEAALIRRGDVAALREAIEAVPEPFREALVLRELEELSYKEIAEITGAPIGTVMSRLARARRMLAARLEGMEAQ
ncbi:MAG: sigma-70 family RNA polymerase sigma factor [Caulobacterales bacterium]